MRHTARTLWAALVLLLGAGALCAQPSSEKILPLDAHFSKNGTLVELNWFDATPKRVGSVTVRRRRYGQTSAGSWQTIATGLGPVMRYTDTTVRPGTAYEYQVLRSARDIVDVGYWLGGTELPAEERRGNAYLILDETITEALGPRLARFEQDLRGDGWRVQRYLTPRGGDDGTALKTLQDALAIREWLRVRYLEDPFGHHSVILIGHVPVLKSGRANPDGHDPVAQVTDLFYADMDGQWNASTDGMLLNNRVPGDFIEMQVGRIDFRVVSSDSTDTEIHLLRAYFDKNHHWRRGRLGDLRDGYGEEGHLTVELFGLRNILGPSAITPGGHHDVGEQKPWLWGVDFGHWDGRAYAKDYANKAVFTLNFGSGKQQFTYPFNPMTALLAQPWYPLAVGWGGRPAWWLHHMALGGTIGTAHFRTVNNGRGTLPYRQTMDYFPTGAYMFRNPVWVNLLGDPTLRAFPLAPVSALQARAAAGGVELTWTAPGDADVRGYKVYRADTAGADFALISGASPLPAPGFTDTAPVENALYMVRAYGLKEVYAGSFYTLSQGTFARVSPASETGPAPPLHLSAPAKRPVPLPEAFNEVTDGQVHALLEGPVLGQLRWQDNRWVYTPPAGFTGDVALRYSVWDGLQTREGRLSLQITD